MTDSASLRFPWPRDGEHANLAVRLFVRDRVWIAALRRTMARWQAQSQSRLPFVQCGTPMQLSVSELSTGSIAVVEVSRGELGQIAEAVRHASRRSLAVIGVLCRTSLVGADDRRAAAELLREAGAALTIRSASKADRLEEVLEWASGIHERRESDPLAELPMPCWGPAWQQGDGRIGLSSQ